jgi:hypothetical protein
MAVKCEVEKFPIDFSDKKKLKSVFSWSAKNGLGPHAGSCPIGQYQTDHCAVIAEIEKRLRNSGFFHGAEIKIKENNPHSWLHNELMATGNYGTTTTEATIAIGAVGDILNAARR